MRSRPRGFTLIELIVYMGLLSILLAIITQVVGASTANSKALRKRTDTLKAALVAVDTFKDDVRAAAAAKLEAKGSSPASLVLTQPIAGRTVRYDVAGAAFVRRVSDGQAETAWRPPFRSESVAFAVDGRCVSLTLELPPGSPRMARGFTLTAAAAIRCPAGQEAQP